MAKRLKACAHCGRTAKMRARGLCITCHRDLAVRAAYPSKQPRGANSPEITAGELDAIVAEQTAALPAWFRGDDKPAEPDGGRDWWATRGGPYREADEAPGWKNWDRPAGAGYALDGGTEPGAVAETQRAAVRAAVKALGRKWTVEKVSDRTVLPVWTVTRRLRELGLL